MRILFVHQNFPGQYLHLARHLASQPDHEVVFITQREDAALSGVRKLVYKAQRTVTRHLHHYLKEAEAGVLNAQAVARVALDLKKSGFIPDVMLGHNGWGEIWYLKDLFPQTPLIGYFEFFYRFVGADVGFDPLRSRLRQRAVHPHPECRQPARAGGRRLGAVPVAVAEIDVSRALSPDVARRP